MPGVGIDGLDHVQVAAPPGCEREARSFYGFVGVSGRALNVNGGW